MNRLNMPLETRWLKLGVAVVSALAFMLPGAALGAPSSTGGAKIDDDVVRQIATIHPDSRVPVLVEATGQRGLPGTAGNAARAQKADDAVRRTGGRLNGQIGLLGGVAAELTAAQLQQLSSDGAVAHISLDRPVHATALAFADAASVAATPITYPQTIGATEAAKQGVTGRGVGVAILDTGIANDPALHGHVKQRVDTVDPVHPNLGDPGGHGTHLAGIIAAESSTLKGVAPGASLVSVRVLDEQGHGRLSTVIRGLEWTVAHRKDLGIKVAVMAMSAPAAGSYLDDPLAGAVEMAWQSGVAVIASAGNDGPNNGTVGSPGFDPRIITVGASDEMGTANVSDDILGFFSSRGPTAEGYARPDLVAPGRKIVSLRVVNSTLDTQMPTHREPNGLFRLTGTSPAAAVAAGAAALVLQQRPNTNPDTLKALLVGSAHSLAGVARSAQGAGSVDAAAALRLRTPSREQARQSFPPARSLARFLQPEVDANGHSFDGSSWDGHSFDGASWDGHSFDGASWDGHSFDGSSWDGHSFDGSSWDGHSFDGSSWDGHSFDGSSWDAGKQLD